MKKNTQIDCAGHMETTERVLINKSKLTYFFARTGNDLIEETEPLLHFLNLSYDIKII